MTTFGGGAIKSGVGRREAVVTAIAIFLIALLVRIWAAAVVNYPRPEDTAYYVGVARNLVEGRGLISDAFWSYGTPPLSFPRSAFEVWLPLPSFLAALPMLLFGTTFGAAQWSSTIVGAIVPVLAWRVAADVAEGLGLPLGRARSLAVGTGLSAAAYLPLVLHSALPDSTMPFAALTLTACLLMMSLVRNPGAAPSARDPRVLGLGLVIGLAALTRNEAIWIAVTWAAIAFSASRGWDDWRRFVGGAAAVAIVVYAPWAVRDWLTFGSPFPGQALSNALSLNGRDIFAFIDQPTLERYLSAGIPTLVGLRVGGFLHNVLNVLLLPGVPASAIGLVGLWWTARIRDLRALVFAAAVIFGATTLIFPVTTTWGTFLHAAGAIHVLVLISALLILDGLLGVAGRFRGWTRPVAWLAPTLTVSVSLLMTLVLLPGFGNDGRLTHARFQALTTVLEAADAPLGPDHPPIITDTPIWLADEARVHTLALPDESPTNVLALAQQFGATLLVVDRDNESQWPEVLDTGAAGADCFRPLALGTVVDPEANRLLEGVRAYQIGCP